MIGFIVGVFVGSVVTLILIALCSAAGRDRDRFDG